MATVTGNYRGKFPPESSHLEIGMLLPSVLGKLAALWTVYLADSRLASAQTTVECPKCPALPLTLSIPA
jgi:hypothetical protein